MDILQAGPEWEVWILAAWGTVLSPFTSRLCDSISLSHSFLNRQVRITHRANLIVLWEPTKSTSTPSPVLTRLLADATQSAACSGESRTHLYSTPGDALHSVPEITSPMRSLSIPLTLHLTFSKIKCYLSLHFCLWIYLAARESSQQMACPLLI